MEDQHVFWIIGSVPNVATDARYNRVSDVAHYVFLARPPAIVAKNLPDIFQ
jgi:hypothetical protein